jgi:DNA-binding MarR family transcriptional regulator
MPDGRTDLPRTPTALDDALEALRCLHLAAQDFRQRFANRAGINVTDALALINLATVDALTSGELASRVGLAPSGATGLVDRLERAGLAVRSTRPGNRRTVFISLTPKGRTELALSAVWAKRAISDLGEARYGEVTSVLSDLAATLTRRAQDFDDARQRRAN